MTKLQRSDISALFNEIAQLLDISDSLFEEAESKYRAVGKWLGKENSPLAIFSPEIYPQGSFRLGTVVKPLGDKDDYDIDLVCELNLSKDKTTQKELKNSVGNRLKANAMYQRMLDSEEGRRCWTLHYADSASFHLDVLPALPDDDDFRLELQQLGVPKIWTNLNIAITDKKLPNYDRIDPDWPRSNPKGYAAWFREQMISQYELQRRQIAKSLKAKIEDVPEFRVKTSLQRSIQLLKRHRDIVFEYDSEDKPVSIIITTLAAHAYNNEADTFDTLVNIIAKMPDYITTSGGQSWVQNPVNPLENFADKWLEYPQRERKFRNWIRKLRVDFAEVIGCDNIDRVGELLESLFGEKVSREVVNNFKKSDLAGRDINIDTGSKKPPVVIIENPNKPWGF